MDRIASKENDHIKEYCKLNTGKQARMKLGKFTIEGFRLCSEAIAWNVPVEYAFMTEEFLASHKDFSDLLSQREIPCWLIDERIKSKISDTLNSQGIFFVCQELQPAKISDFSNKEHMICFYDIQDPGNLGTMIRSADAFGFDAVILSNNTCDLFSPKVMRASMGSVFHLPFYIAEDMITFENEMKRLGKTTAAAVLSGFDFIVGSCNLPKLHLLYIGNEGNGLSASFAALCDYRITLQMKGKAESLNAAMAAGILMWELTK